MKAKGTSFWMAAAMLMLLTAMAGCGKKSSTSGEADITRLDRIVRDYPAMTAQERESTLRDNFIPLTDYLYMMGFTGDNPAAEIDTLAASAAYSYFQPDIEERLTDLSPIEKKLSAMTVNLAGRFLSFPQYSYYGVVSPFNQQIMLTDSIAFIALNHYLGADYPGYESMPQYRRAVKTPANIPYDVAEAIVAVNMPYLPDADATTVNRLIYEGALTAAVLDAIPGADIAEFLGWNEDEYKEMTANEGALFDALVAFKLLYSTDPSVAERLVAPAPSTSIISPDVPGRAGRFIGYRLVRKYSDASGVDIARMLTPEFYNNPSDQLKVLGAR